MSNRRRYRVVSMSDSERSFWDINPLKTTIELSDGKVRMRESAIYNGQVRISETVDTQIGEPECVWLYIQAESRDGADVKLTPEQAKEMRDALSECIDRYEDTTGDDDE